MKNPFQNRIFEYFVPNIQLCSMTKLSMNHNFNQKYINFKYCFLQIFEYLINYLNIWFFLQYSYLYPPKNWVMNIFVFIFSLKLTLQIYRSKIWYSSNTLCFCKVQVTWCFCSLICLQCLQTSIVIKGGKIIWRLI